LPTENIQIYQDGTDEAVGVVVPTLGIRPQSLEECLKSIRLSGNCFLVLVAPLNVQAFPESVTSLCDSFVVDEGRGLSAAINSGLRSLPTEIRFATWIGDDDTLKQHSMTWASSAMQIDSSLGLVFGSCEYVNRNGQLLFVNHSGRFAFTLMKYGPQLLPQPGSLFRLDLFHQVGGLNESLKFAFDLDLFLRIGKVSNFLYLNQVLGTYRWHADSLTAGSRYSSVTEASKVRKSHLPISLRRLSNLWEIPLQISSICAGTLLSRRENKSLK
jgi:hypothetical protein